MSGKAMTDDDRAQDAGAEPSGSDAERRQKAREAFERGIIERGEAAPADENGKLPPGVTHEIVGHDAAGRPILKRRRFSVL
jgi:hypothetical protein